MMKKGKLGAGGWGGAVTDSLGSEVRYGLRPEGYVGTPRQRGHRRAPLGIRNNVSKSRRPG